MSPKKIVLNLIILITLPLSTLASEAYFGADAIAPTLLSPPFAKGSKQQQKDIEYILQLQKNLDPEEIKKINDEVKMRPEMVTLAVMPELTRADYPALYNLLDNVGKTSHQITDATKAYWKADRPYMVDKRITPLVKPKNDKHSYPSGHSTGSHIWAQVMGMVIPEKKDEFYARAEAIAIHRALAGVHYPNDLEAGRKLATLMADKMQKNKRFLADLDAAREEVGSKK